MSSIGNATITAANSSSSAGFSTISGPFAYSGSVCSADRYSGGVDIDEYIRNKVKEILEEKLKDELDITLNYLRLKLEKIVENDEIKGLLSRKEEDNTPSNAQLLGMIQEMKNDMAELTRAVNSLLQFGQQLSSTPNITNPFNGPVWCSSNSVGF